MDSHKKPFVDSSKHAKLSLEEGRREEKEPNLKQHKRSQDNLKCEG